jgi:hypothetical protein
MLKKLAQQAFSIDRKQQIGSTSAIYFASRAMLNRSRTSDILLYRFWVAGIGD